mgnify:CR=1 FL=1
MSELPKFARFYMVCRKPSGALSKTEPRQRYSTPEDARSAALNLANQNDAPFIILEAVEIIRPGDTAEGRLL